MLHDLKFSLQIDILPNTIQRILGSAFNPNEESTTVAVPERIKVSQSEPVHLYVTVPCKISCFSFHHTAKLK